VAQVRRASAPGLNIGITQGNLTMLKVYGFSKVNAGARGYTRDLRVLWALDEMRLPFEIAGMDHPAHDLNSDAYRQLSPF
jgi:glutathione S-transferase